MLWWVAEDVHSKACMEEMTLERTVLLFVLGFICFDFGMDGADIAKF
jgi:hypothetical protein